MERQEILIRFADLRRLACSMPAYIVERVGVDEQLPSLNARIEDDLGCMGADMLELLEEFSESFHVDVANFDFTGLISPEGLDSLGCLLALPLAAYFLIGWLLKTVAGLLCWPFDKPISQAHLAAAGASILAGGGFAISAQAAQHR